MLNRLLFFLAVPALYPFAKVFQRSWLFWISIVEFFQFVQATYKVPSRIPGQVRIVTSPTCVVFKGSTYNLASQDFFDFLFIFAINLDWQWWLVLLSWQQVFRCFPKFVWREDWVDLHRLWQFDPVQVANLLKDWVWSCHLVVQLAAWSFCFPVLHGDLHRVSNIEVRFTSVFVSLLLH